MGDQRDQAPLLRDHYLNNAKRSLSQAAAGWFTDKALTHELYLGFAHLLFPASPIIHIVRHPLDVVVSNYANGLPHGGFAGGVGEVAEYYKLLLETAEHSGRGQPRTSATSRSVTKTSWRIRRAGRARSWTSSACHSTRRAWISTRTPATAAP